MRHVFRMMLVVAVAAGRAHAQLGDSSALAEQLFDQARDRSAGFAIMGRF